VLKGLKTAHSNQKFINEFLKKLASEKKLLFVADSGKVVIIFISVRKTLV